MTAAAQDIEGRNETSVPPVNHVSEDMLLFMDIVVTITNLCLGAVTFGAFFIAISVINVLPQYSAHIILVVLGYAIIISQGVLSLNTTSGWGRTLKHRQRRAAHFVLQVVGCISVITGASIAIANSNSNTNKSIHGIMGIIAISFTFLTLLGGIFNYLFPDSNKVKSVKFIHSALGSITLILAFVTLLIALHREYGAPMAWAYTVCAVVGLMGTLLSAVISNIKRLTQ